MNKLHRISLSLRKIASGYHPLQYLLTLPVMSRIKGISESNFEFEAFGKRGLYQYKNKEDLTLQELIQLLPDQKYQFEIEYEQEQKLNLLEEAKILNEIAKRKPELKEKLEKLEQEIAKNPKDSYEYALVIKERFSEFEKRLNSYEFSNNDSLYILRYVARFLDKDMKKFLSPFLQIKFERLEKKFNKIKYPSDAKDFLYDNRDEIDDWPGIEKFFLNAKPEDIVRYARDYKKARVPICEPVIMENPYAACYYARDVIKGRWPEAEPYIIKNPRIAALYALEVIKGRWSEAELIIAKSNSNERRKYDIMIAKSEDIKLNFALADYLKNPNYIYEKLNKIEIKLKVQPGTILKTLKKYLSDEYILPFLLCHDNRRMTRFNYLKDISRIYYEDYRIESVTEHNIRSTKQSTLDKWKKAIDMIDVNRKKLQGKE